MAGLGRVDGVLHSIGFVPAGMLGDDFMAAQWDDVAVALHISTYSLKALADAFVPLMTDGGTFVGLDFDNRVAWPAYNWMGVAKSALQSVNRYLAKSSARRASAATSSPPGRCARWRPRASPASPVRGHLGRAGPARLGHQRPEPVAKACVALLSDWFPATTGEIVHVDGGFHSTGAAATALRTWCGLCPTSRAGRSVASAP